MKNPLKRPIWDILSKTSSPLKEYQLHELLDNQAFEEFIVDCSSDLALFRRHFLVMNALYELHEELKTEGMAIYISALDIHLERIQENRQQSLQLLSGFDKLSEYYRDWQNFMQTDQKEVDQLLQSFWQRYLNLEECQQSLQCLGLNSTATWQEIRREYQRLCRKHHPDKGGDSLEFIHIRQAYENLKSIYTRDT